MGNFRVGVQINKVPVSKCHFISLDKGQYFLYMDKLYRRVKQYRTEHTNELGEWPAIHIKSGQLVFFSSITEVAPYKTVLVEAGGENDE